MKNRIISILKHFPLTRVIDARRFCAEFQISKGEIAELLLKDNTFDYAVPQWWFDANPDTRQDTVWLYRNSCGEPYSLMQGLQNFLDHQEEIKPEVEA